MEALAKAAIDTVNSIAGRHERTRALHARGVLCGGKFTPAADASELSRAALLQAEVPVIARFSNGSGNPNTPDWEPDGRGLAVKFYLPDGSRTDIVAVTLPAFFVRRPEDFAAFTRAARRNPRNGKPGPALALYLIRHREALTALRAAAAFKPVPSYANCRYNGIHAFKWTNASGESNWVRYSWIPEAGEATLDPIAAKALGERYLTEEISRRFESGPVRFTLQVQIAEPGDPIDDPTKVWPATRRTAQVGQLELAAIDTSREQGDDILVFDPTRVTDGIDPSDDPILHFRSYAYSESVLRRSGVSRPPGL